MDPEISKVGVSERYGRRQLVIFFDGTNNTLTGGSNDTNVARLCELALADGNRQIIYYDPGVGNPGNIPGVVLSDKIRGKLERLWGLALGRGVYENIANGYLFLMRNWRVDDDIYLYGFSRGAFTARSLAGLVDRFGILQPSMESMVPMLLHMYFVDPEKDKNAFERVRLQIKESFSDPDRRNAAIWFIGVWDTVESVGSLFSKTKIRAGAGIDGKRMHHVRHALALDEYRRSFAPRLYEINPAFPYAKHQQSIRQHWFSGAHCDVGGGYALGDSALSVQTLFWILNESVAQGLKVKPQFLVNGAIDRDSVFLALQRYSKRKGLGPPLVHSETYDTAWWAIAGLKIRANGGGRPAGSSARPNEDASVAINKLQFPRDTVWQKRQRSRAGLLAWTVAALVAFVIHGMALTAGTETSKNLLDWPGAAIEANASLVCWQMGDWQLHRCLAKPYVVGHWVWMVLADLALIVSYGYVLARGVTLGFGYIAGLRRVGSPTSRLSNALGLALPITLGADIIEDAFTLLTQVFIIHDGHLVYLFYCFAFFMSLASTIKWAGFLVCATLGLGGFLARITRK